MSTDPFPDSGPDDPGVSASGKQPADGNGLEGDAPGFNASGKPAGGNKPEDDWDGDAHLEAVIAAADAGEYEMPDWPDEDLPAGFTPDGTADLMGPGPVLAALVHAAAGRDGAALTALPDDELLKVIRAARRMESRAVWTHLAAVREFAARRAAGPGPDWRNGFREFAAEELAWELNLTWQAAEREMAYACSVADRLPRTFAALAAGQIHPVHVLIIADETAYVPPDVAALADEVLARAAQSKTFGQLRYTAHRLVIKLDPESARRRKEDASKDAHVRRFRESSGNAGMVAREMPADEVLASWQHVEQRALDLRAAGSRAPSKNSGSRPFSISSRNETPATPRPTRTRTRRTARRPRKTARAMTAARRTAVTAAVATADPVATAPVAAVPVATADPVPTAPVVRAEPAGPADRAAAADQADTVGPVGRVGLDPAPAVAGQPGPPGTPARASRPR